MGSTEALPPSKSPQLALLHPTYEETIAIWNLNGQVWRGRLSMEAYIRRDQHLADQALTRNGGITSWILTDTTKTPNARPILSSCESIKKQAYVKRGNEEVREVISHGIGSVFCDPQYRGRGYAKRMVEELGKKLDTWAQPESTRTNFSVLYSDIGKKFYAKSGWKAFTSSHISLPPTIVADLPTTSVIKPLLAPNLAELCRLDQEMLRKSLVQLRQESNKIRVALIPDLKTMSWHHAREEFVAQEVLGRVPQVKGVYVQCNGGKRAWCIWSRFFGSVSVEGNTLYILRMVVEGEESTASHAFDNLVDGTNTSVVDREQVDAVVRILREAQIEAAQWGMNDVQIWNPSTTVMDAAKNIDRSVRVIYRDEDSIASLKWHLGDNREAATVEWVGNDKYGWC